MRRVCATLSIVLAAVAAAAGERRLADTFAVEVAGQPGAYEFRVTVWSPDESCSRYASWWEVVRADGSLAYRRILNHSHPGEQPFTRAGGPVPVGPDEVIVVRAFLHPDGYGGASMRGTARGGFKPWTGVPRDFAAGLATAAPQPERCLY